MLTRFEPYKSAFDFPRGFGRLFGPGFFEDSEEKEMSHSDWRPLTDVFETKEEYVFKFELPGISKDDINIEYENRVLTVKGERKEDKDIKKEYYHRFERYQGQFSRSFNLPKNVDESKITANMKDGILELKVPKAEEAKVKAIPIKVN